jgi:leucyl aminopeptidase
LDGTDGGITRFAREPTLHVGVGWVLCGAKIPPSDDEKNKELKMLTCFTQQAKNSTPIYLLTKDQLPVWLSKQTLQLQSWVEHLGFTAKAGEHILLTDESGSFSGVLLGMQNASDVWQLGQLPLLLPQAVYHVETKFEPTEMHQALIAWGLGSYQFTRYKEAKRTAATLLVPKHSHFKLVTNLVESTYLVRDLINTPAEDMGPLELAEEAVELGQKYHASVNQIVSEDLLDEMYPAIFTVGRASYSAPRLIDIQWGDLDAPKVTLVGKGVCFDTGGLDIKPTDGMALMKKDMGGAAHALGLARMIMEANLPVRLRVLIPAVENAVSGDAYHPGDVITMRNGKTVEVTNTDAEGRLVLGDALVEASSEQPELLIDFSTLTGAARVAVGTEISAMFTNTDSLASRMEAFGAQENDPIWRLPLYQDYFKLLKSDIADFTNSAAAPYAGATTAALFLQEFVHGNVPWMHFDIMAWNVNSRPGHPKGGEAMSLRAVFAYLRQRFSAQH